MAVLLMRLVAPMQSWGSRSVFEYRDTELEPTLSGIIGMIAAAEGSSRSEDLSAYLSLRLSVRVDREGVMSREFQTAENVIHADRKSHSTQILYRDYLADAAFHVALDGPEDLIHRLFLSLKRPMFPVYLGRKSYVPSLPTLYPGSESLFEDGQSSEQVLDTVPLVDPSRPLTLSLTDTVEDVEPHTVRFVVTSDSPTGEIRRDVPQSFSINDRRYGTRYVRTMYKELPMTAGGQGGRE